MKLSEKDGPKPVVNVDNVTLGESPRLHLRLDSNQTGRIELEFVNAQRFLDFVGRGAKTAEQLVAKVIDFAKRGINGPPLEAHLFQNSPTTLTLSLEFQRSRHDYGRIDLEFDNPEQFLGMFVSPQEAARQLVDKVLELSQRHLIAPSLEACLFPTGKNDAP